MFSCSSCLLFALATCVSAQTPDPAPGGLDAVQQVFPIEAARVLAWMRNTGDAKIADVAATLERSDATGAAWKLAWRDSAGKTVRERHVEIAASRVEEGPAFYREVFGQLTGEDWAIQSASPDNSATAFWQGAELGAISRTEAITAAAKLLADKPRMERAADAARLAGVLIHAAVPSVAGRRPIDGRLLARGAAWLCVAEKRLHEPLTASWAPILYMAGRESEAAGVWQSPEAVIKMRTAAERFWAMALVQATAESAFNFAARRENRSWAIPAMFLFLRKDARLSAPVGEIVETLDKDFVARFHDYSPVVNEAVGAEAAWKRLRGELPAAAAAGAAGKLEPVAYFLTADLTDAAAPGATLARNGGLSEMTDEQVATLAKNAIAAAAAAPEPNAPGQPAGRERVVIDAMPTLNTSDETWAYLQKLKEGPGYADSPEDGMRRMRAWLARQRTVAEQFNAKYPADPRRWEAVTMSIEAAMRQGEFDQGKGKAEAQKRLASIIEEPGVSAGVKGDAAFLSAALDLTEVNGVERHTLPPFLRKLSEFIDNYPDHPRVAEAAGLQMQILQQGEVPGADRILEKLSGCNNSQVAMQANAMLVQRIRLAEMKKKPIELKFTAADGREVDFAKLRGKVVLLDFWASWCGPCMAEAPNVVAAYKKLHERGFEIVGICLDQDKAAMEGAIQRAGLTWSHHFDGKGWENEIAQRFGIRSIPATWLFDKQGKLRDIGLRGQELEAGVERLMRE